MRSAIKYSKSEGWRDIALLLGSAVVTMLLTWFVLAPAIQDLLFWTYRRIGL